MKEEKTLSSELVYKGRVISLRIDTVITTDGRTAKREIVVHNGAVAMVAVDEKDNILLVRQFRTPAGKVLLEVPAGTIEQGEKPDETVPRELQEETGYLPQKVTKLGGFYSAPGFSTEFIHIYLTTNLKPSRLEADDTKEIELIRMPVNEAKKLIDSGTICDAKSVAGILLYMNYLKTHKP
jgi:ADP-ribose pyrophosphatase